jgi:hypothetical protein
MGAEGLYMYMYMYMYIHTSKPHEDQTGRRATVKIKAAGEETLSPTARCACLVVALVYSRYIRDTRTPDIRRRAGYYNHDAG